MIVFFYFFSQRHCMMPEVVIKLRREFGGSCLGGSQEPEECQVSFKALDDGRRNNEYDFSA